MFRVYNRKTDNWIYDLSDIYMNHEDELVKIKKGLFGRKIQLLPSEYIVQMSTNVYDTKGNMIFEGDIIKNGNVEALVTYVKDKLSFVALDRKKYRYYLLTEDICREQIEVIGNVFDNPYDK